MFRAIFHTFCGKSTFFLVSFTLFLGITGSVQATEKSTLSASFTEQIDTHFTTAVDFLAGQLFSDFGTGIPLIVMWLIIGAVFFTLRMGFINLRGFRHALAVTQGAYDVPADKGEVTQYDTLQIVPDSECRVGCAVQQRRQHDRVVLGTGDRANQVLVLLVESVEQCQLLLPMGSIVEHVDVQRHLAWRLSEGVDEAVDEPVFQPQKRPR